MRLLLATSSEAWRGPSTSFEKLAHGLLERGHEVAIVTADPALTARLARLGGPVTEIPRRQVGPREVWSLLTVLRRLGAEAVLADSLRDLRLSAGATLVHRAPIVYRCNLAGPRSRPGPLDRVCLSRVAACVFQSRWVQQSAAMHLPSLRRLPGYHVPNGYDTTAYSTRPDEGARFREEWGIAPDASVVVTLGKLTRAKGQEVAVAALGQLHRNGVSMVYVLCGDGEREGELRAHAGLLRLPVVFTGTLDAEGVVAALSAADIVVHPSLTEIFPNAVGEAMACGRPVVAADAGGTAELVGPSGLAGLLVPPGDPVALAHAVEALLADPQRRARLGKAARQRIQSEFPLARMIDGYERVFREVVSDR